MRNNNNNLWQKIMFKICFVALIITGCNNGDEKAQLQKQIQQLTIENNTKQDKIDVQEKTLSALNERMNNLEQAQAPQPSGPIANSTPEPTNAGNQNTYGKKYYFIVLNVREVEAYSARMDGQKEVSRYYYVSSVGELDYVDEDVKYKLMDEMVVRYKQTDWNNSKSIDKRRIYLFDSYQSASKAREKYVINK
jgi:hypothetical protein